MSAQSPRASARLFAPIALIACAIAVLVILAGSFGGDDSDSPTATSEPTGQSDTDTQTTPEPSAPANYTVKAGDTLGAISEETGVSVETIELLNPEVDPQALIAGQKLKLRE
jgi:LysM repeat protein